MAGRVIAKLDKPAAVLTAIRCYVCDARVMSDKVITVRVVSFEGTRRTANYLERHNTCV